MFDSFTGIKNNMVFNGSTYEEYFKSFFADGGEFQKYASILGGTTEVTKVGGEYKVGVTVSVRKDDLRKALEAAGVIRSLNSGF